MSLKTIQLDFWMSRNLYDVDSMVPCKPVYNRDGQYFDTKTKRCWFEVDGDAFLHDKNSFIFSLRVLNHRPLRQTERDAINVLLNNRLAPNSLRELIDIDNMLIEIKQNAYRAKKFKRRVLAKMKNSRKLINDN